MFFNRNIIIEKYSSVYNLMNLQPEIDFHKDGENLMVKQLEEYFNILNEHLEFDMKEEMISCFKGNVDYFLNNKTVNASIDGDDWNSLCLYTEYALYKLTKKNPIHIFELERYGEYNKKRFQLFLTGKGDFRLKT